MYKRSLNYIILALDIVTCLWRPSPHSNTRQWCISTTEKQTVVMSCNFAFSISVRFTQKPICGWVLSIIINLVTFPCNITQSQLTINVGSRILHCLFYIGYIETIYVNTGRFKQPCLFISYFHAEETVFEKKKTVRLVWLEGIKCPLLAAL